MFILGVKPFGERLVKCSSRKNDIVSQKKTLDLLSRKALHRCFYKQLFLLIAQKPVSLETALYKSSYKSTFNLTHKLNLSSLQTTSNYSAQINAFTSTIKFKQNTEIEKNSDPANETNSFDSPDSPKSQEYELCRREYRERSSVQLQQCMKRRRLP